MNEAVKARGHWVFVVGHPDGSKTVTEADNLITTAGLQFLAESVSRAAGVIATYSDADTNFAEEAVCVVSDGLVGTLAITDTYTEIANPLGIAKGVFPGYPRIEDTDPSNTAGAGPDVVTWKFYWNATEEPCATGGYTLTHAAVCETASAGKPLLNRVAATTTIGAGDTLTIFLNVTFA
jgi:hypothetical protein